MSYYLAIVSPLDAPLYELSFSSLRPSSSTAAPGANASNNFPSWSSFTSSSLSGEPSTPTTAGSSHTLNGQNGVVAGGPAVDRHLCQMIAHASLDAVEEVLEGTGSLYLKNVDRHNQWLVSAFIATHVKFILLHDQKNEDGIRLFFLELWELYVKTSLNPFHTSSSTIRSNTFDGKVRASAKRML